MHLLVYAKQIRSVCLFVDGKYDPEKLHYLRHSNCRKHILESIQDNTLFALISKKKEKLIYLTHDSRHLGRYFSIDYLCNSQCDAKHEADVRYFLKHCELHRLTTLPPKYKIGEDHYQCWIQAFRQCAKKSIDASMIEFILDNYPRKLAEDILLSLPTRRKYTELPNKATMEFLQQYNYSYLVPGTIRINLADVDALYKISHFANCKEITIYVLGLDSSINDSFLHSDHAEVIAQRNYKKIICYRRLCKHIIYNDDKEMLTYLFSRKMINKKRFMLMFSEQFKNNYLFHDFKRNLRFWTSFVYKNDPNRLQQFFDDVVEYVKKTLLIKFLRKHGLSRYISYTVICAE